MTKKKKRKRKVQYTAPAAPPPPQARQERKEAARRERERIFRSARRRQLTRRAVRWTALVVAVAAVTGFVSYRVLQDRTLIQRADAAASDIGCGEIEELPNEGRAHLQPGSAAPTYATTPAASGPHSPSTLAPGVEVYDEPVPEVQAVHNLEHAYVLIYYRADGPEALDDEVREALAGLAEGQTKVILAPYPELPEGTSLAFVAWTKLQECPAVTDADQAILAAEGFIKRYRGTTNAPEPSAA